MIRKKPEVNSSGLFLCKIFFVFCKNWEFWLYDAEKQHFKIGDKRTRCYDKLKVGLKIPNSFIFWAKISEGERNFRPSL